MQFKPVPEPPIDVSTPAAGVAAVETVRDGVPLASAASAPAGADHDAPVDPDETNAPPRPARGGDGDLDCCARLVDRTPVRDRAAATAWLTFLRALDVVTVTHTETETETEPDGTFVRQNDDLDPAAIRRSFRDRVYRAEAVLDTLDRASDPLDAAAVADRLEPVVGGRAREADRRGDAVSPGTPTVERVDRLLGWAVAFGLADRVGDSDSDGDGDEDEDEDGNGDGTRVRYSSISVST